MDDICLRRVQIINRQIQVMKTSNQRPLAPKVEPVRFIERSNGTIKGYAVNTFHGLVKNYNEDRVSIIMNITKPNHKGRWPRCSYFAVFDGHGGNKCSDFLKENMHRYITQNAHFPHQPIDALKFGFKKAEQEFLAFAEAQNPVQRSGSCAIVILIVDDTCYIANVGDSRAILSANGGDNIYPISKDHKPDSESEKERIYNAGGRIYQSSVKGKTGNVILGPHRIQPGKLSVSRSFGDIEAKLPRFEGNPKVLIAKPEITYFEVNNTEHDFIVMCSDGVYDKLQNNEVAQCFWQTRNHSSLENYHFIGSVPSKIIQRSMEKMSTDNLTSLVICFEDHGRILLPPSSKHIQKESHPRPKSSLASEQENVNRLNRTRNLTPSQEMTKGSKLAKIEEMDASLESSRELPLKGRKELERSTRDSRQAKKEGLMKRKSSANLGGPRLESLNSSVSAKLLMGSSKVFQKRREGEKVNIKDLIEKRKGEQIKKETLLGQMVQQRANPNSKLIRF